MFRRGLAEMHYPQEVMEAAKRMEIVFKAGLEAEAKKPGLTQECIDYFKGDWNIRSVIGVIGEE